MLDVDNLGQVFTPQKTVDKMLMLRKNNGTILEPSCGAGAFFNSIKNCIGIEYDKTVCPKNALNINFFDYSLENQFDTIIGNPPYVKYQSIGNETKEKLDLTLFNERANLYLFFIEKSIKHLKTGGELIFIVPRDFIKSSSSILLNNFIYKSGTITDWIDLGDEIIFPGFTPNCVIFRFEKDNFTRKTKTDHGEVNFVNMHGQLIFSKNEYSINFSDLFMVKVGGASGADEIFTSENGNCEFVYSKTAQSGETKRMHYNQEHEELLIHKEALLNRGIKPFNENNWYTWGRNYFESDKPRIYVNAKTRNDKPFFIHQANAYDGSILAIFPKFKIEDLNIICNELNNINWEDLGFVCDGRYLFGQKSLEQIMLPSYFNKYLELSS